ncbi:3'-5' exoribonuclease domain-containing protein [Agromyces sp. NPDC057679]|uniref:3'-5' exoribonuclease domain-containing protein n=1 Tax=Agromyces sp. NPDC057679 TaxID=3346207 RepID=UPI00366E34D7
MKVFFDTEFIEDGRTIDLLSIGIVREDGATYYAEPAETDRSRASAWVIENVFPHLTGPVKPRQVIAQEIVEFAGERPEFWAYVAAYDWVALCQLYGRLLDIPAGWPKHCNDLKQEARRLGARLPKDGLNHNALVDAVWARDGYLKLHHDAFTHAEFSLNVDGVAWSWYCTNCGTELGVHLGNTDKQPPQCWRCGSVELAWELWESDPSD